MKERATKKKTTTTKQEGKIESENTIIVFTQIIFGLCAICCCFNFENVLNEFTLTMSCRKKLKRIKTRNRHIGMAGPNGNRIERIKQPFSNRTVYDFILYREQRQR